MDDVGGRLFPDGGRAVRSVLEVTLGDGDAPFPQEERGNPVGVKTSSDKDASVEAEDLDRLLTLVRKVYIHAGGKREVQMRRGVLVARVDE